MPIVSNASNLKQSETGPYFTVVIPAFNRAATIRPTLDSVLQQTFTDWECIVVDDGSSDGAQLEQVIESYDDPRLRYVRQLNAGGGAARNTGIQMASGEFIALLDSDDMFVPHKLSTFAELIDPRAREAYYSPVFVRRRHDAYWVRPDRLINPDESVADYLFVYNQFIQTSSIILKRDLALEVPFDPALRKGQDLDFCVRLDYEGVRFVGLAEPLAIWVDDTEENRTSRHAGSAAPLRWLDAHVDKLGERATYGYRANVLAYYVAQDRPLTALRFLIDGATKGRVPPTIIARQFLRCFMPRRAYRQLVDAFVRLRTRNMN